LDWFGSIGHIGGGLLKNSVARLAAIRCLPLQASHATRKRGCQKQSLELLVQSSVGREGTEVGPIFESDRLPTFTIPKLIQYGSNLRSTRFMSRYWNSMILLVLLGLTASCSSLTTWNGTHAGIRYTIHKDPRNHRIERGESGRLLYDSPELTVSTENGMLWINGHNAGNVEKGDHVEITSYGTVLVNDERRGDTSTGRDEMKKRLEMSKSIINQAQS